MKLFQSIDAYLLERRYILPIVMKHNAIQTKELYKPKGEMRKLYYWLTLPRNPKSGSACLSSGWSLCQASCRCFLMIPTLPNLPLSWEMEHLKRKAEAAKFHAGMEAGVGPWETDFWRWRWRQKGLRDGKRSRRKRWPWLVELTAFGDQNNSHFYQSIFSKSSVLLNPCYTAFCVLSSSFFWQ